MSYYAIVLIKALIALTQFCKMRDLSIRLDNMPMAADLTEFVADLKKVGDSMEKQNNFIYLYLNTLFIAVMIVGNVIHFSQERNENMFC